MKAVALGLFLGFERIEQHFGFFGCHFFGGFRCRSGRLLIFLLVTGFRLLLGLLVLFLFLLLIRWVLRLFLLIAGLLLLLVLLVILLLLLVLLLLLHFLNLLLLEDGQFVVGLGIGIGRVEGDGIFIHLDRFADGFFTGIEIGGWRGRGHDLSLGRHIDELEERVAAVVVGLGLKGEIGARGGIGEMGGGGFGVARSQSGNAGIQMGGGGIQFAGWCGSGGGCERFRGGGIVAGGERLQAVSE